MDNAAQRTVVFVHGLWVTADSWSTFRQPWEAAGYSVLTPTWRPLAGLAAAGINGTIPADLGGLSITTIVDDLQAFIGRLEAPPLLVGHSFGGLFVQLLLDRGVGRAGIAINPAPIGGIVPGFWTLRAALRVILRRNGWNRPYALTRQLWSERYANAAPAALRDEAFDNYVIPTSGRAIHQAAFWIKTRVRPERRRQPLLITESDRDRLVTPYLSRSAWRIQSRSPARTDFQTFPGRSHLLIAEPGWEEVATHALAWADRHAHHIPAISTPHREEKLI
jgi:pimeloyl-ACP methyl ester carboxylesterase